MPLQGAGIPPGGIHGGSAEHRVDLKDYSNEIYQVAEYEGPVTLTLASFAVTRKPFGKVLSFVGLKGMSLELACMIWT